MDAFGPSVGCNADIRLEKPKGKAKIVSSYKTKAQTRFVLRAAAQSWANGVPWEEALRIAEGVSRRLKEAKKAAKG